MSPCVQTLFSASILTQKADELVRMIEEEQLYLLPDLRLNELAAKLDLPEKKLSFILNHHIKKGFNDFINEFHINAALQQMGNGAFHHRTMEGIAWDVGFSSRTTFYRAFKKVTGEHPTEYINRRKKHSSIRRTTSENFATPAPGLPSL